MSFRSIVLLVACELAISAAQLRPATLAAWNAYIETAQSRLQNEETEQVLWVDQVPGRRERLRSGEIIASPMHGKSPHVVPHGLIHDWIGAVFIPGVSLRGVLDVLRDYDRYAEYYGPTILNAKLLSRNGERESFRVRYFRKALFVTVVLDVEFEVRFCRVDEHRWYSVARSAAVREIRNYGEPGEHTLPVDDGSGYIWRAFSTSRLDESDGGVYLEQESIALSRTIPVEFRLLVGPFVERLSRELMIRSLRQTRNAAIGPDSPMDATPYTRIGHLVPFRIDFPRAPRHSFHGTQGFLRQEIAAQAGQTECERQANHQPEHHLPAPRLARDQIHAQALISKVTGRIQSLEHQQQTMRRERSATDAYERQAIWTGLGQPQR